MYLRSNLFHDAMNYLLSEPMMTTIFTAKFTVNTYNWVGISMIFFNYVQMFGKHKAMHDDEMTNNTKYFDSKVP